MVDHSTVKLGKGEPVEWPLKLSNFCTPELEDPPLECYNSRGIKDFGMMKNDVLGLCVIAKGFHALQIAIMSWIDPTVNQALIGVIHPSDDLIVDYYRDWGGYVLGDDSTDNGMEVTTMLKDWVSKGLAGYKLPAFADPDPQNLVHVKQSIAFFGGLDIGLRLPREWQNAKVWDYVKHGTLGSWGLHNVWVVDYDKNGIWVITWGGLQFITWAGYRWAVDEAHTLVLVDFKPRLGFDLDGMKKALASIIG